MKTKIRQKIVAVAAAALLVGVLWPLTVAAQQAPPDKPQAQQRTRMGPMGRMGREALNLTPEQEKKLQEFREARMKDREAFRGQMMKMREDMGTLMKDPKANGAKIDALIDQMFKMRADQAKSAFRDREALKGIFTPEQLEKMKEMRGAFRGGPGFAGRGRFGFAGPGMGFRMGMGMGRMMGGRGGRGMGRQGMFWRHPFFWWRW
jgi:Spy/CpxP family protein refolding chaperone